MDMICLMQCWHTSIESKRIVMSELHVEPHYLTARQLDKDEWFHGNHRHELWFG